MPGAAEPSERLGLCRPRSKGPICVPRLVVTGVSRERPNLIRKLKSSGGGGGGAKGEDFGVQVMTRKKSWQSGRAHDSRSPRRRLRS